MSAVVQILIHYRVTAGGGSGAGNTFFHSELAGNDESNRLRLHGQIRLSENEKFDGAHMNHCYCGTRTLERLPFNIYICNSLLSMFLLVNCQSHPGVKIVSL